MLFRYYAREHLSLAARGFPLVDETGRRLGVVDRIGLLRNRIEIEGWTEADRVTVLSGGDRHSVVPALKRADVTAAQPELRTPTPGFRLDLPCASDQIHIAVQLGARSCIYVVEPFPASVRKRAALRLLPRYLAALAAGLPAYLHWRFTGSAAARARLKTLLGFDRVVVRHVLDPRLLAGESDESVPGAGAVTIVLPVYNAMDVLPEALDRVSRHTDLPWHLILIEDGSTDPAVRPFLRHWVAGRPAGQVALIENSANMGFIRSVNLGLSRALDRGDHVILLNSDALVPAGWASRLLEPILRAPDSVATVTPVSNDAEILSVPVIAMRGALHPGDADRIDAVAAGFDRAAAQVEAPTGIGFCMAMNIRHLKLEPAFDVAFGRGYGEEVDWCQKIRAAGGRHAAVANLFVEHRGGASFGSTEKLQLVARNNAMVSARYPAYDAEIQDFIRNDPMATARLALAIGWAAARGGDRPIPVYLGHALGGGAEDYLTARIARDLDPAGAGLPAALVLRVGTAYRWQLEVHCALGVTQGATDDFALVAALLRPLPRLLVVYSCGVDDRDPMDLPGRLLSLLRGPQDRAEALFHDYLPVSPSYNLLDSDGVHRGLPPPDTAEKAHGALRPDGSVASNADWRQAWGRFLAACETIVTFSPNSRDLVAAAFPDLRDRIVVEPHEPLVDLPRVRPVAPAGRPVIGVLGNIGRQKGAGVLSELSFRLATSGEADLVLVGNIDPEFPLASQTIVHGTYARRDIPDLIARYGITCWLIPSIWPETFSYTTHECIATGLPVWSFDLGAQGDAVRAAAARSGLGGTLPLRAGRPPVESLIAQLLRDSGTGLPVERAPKRREDLPEAAEGHRARRDGHRPA
jgi:GT2 family glycosyltransferase